MKIKKQLTNMNEVAMIMKTFRLCWIDQLYAKVFGYFLNKTLKILRSV